jgi:hypothetical protein
MNPRITLLLLCFFAPCFGADWQALPLIEGQISGELKAFGNTPDTAVKWSITTSAAESGFRILDVAASSAGLAAKLSAKLDVTSKTGTWSMQQGEVDLGKWFKAMVLKLSPDFGELDVSGSLRMSGQGNLSIGEGLLGGEMVMSVDHMRMSAGADGSWSINNISGQFVLQFGRQLQSPAGQRITFAEGKLGEIALSSGIAELQLLSGHRLRVQSLRFQVAGGTVLVKPFETELGASTLALEVRVEGLEVEQLSRYFPEAVAEVKGKVSGRLQVLWSGEKGWRFGRGELSLIEKSAATVRLAPSPGLLTSKVPRTLELVGYGPEFFRRWFRQPNPAYEALRRIEMGEETLTVASLASDLEDNDNDGISNIQTRFVAQPTNPQSAAAVRRLNLNLNISAPLVEMLKIGSTGQLSFD